MIELITDMNVVSKLLNCSVPNKFLSVSLNYDGYRTVAPKIIKSGQQSTLLTRHIEQGNVEAMQDIDKTLPKDLPVVYYNPYFLFEPACTPVFGEFIDAFTSVAGTEKQVQVHKDLPLSIYQWMSMNYEIEIYEKEIADPGFYVYEFSRADVIKRFAVGRAEADSAALKLIEKSPIKKRLEYYIKERTDTRFSVLDGLMKANGVDAILCTSPLGIQEITGFGMERHIDDMFAAYYEIESDKVQLFSVEPLEDFGQGRKVSTFGAAIKDQVNNGILGLEEQHFPLGWFRGLGFDKIKTVNAMNLVRLLREKTGSENLSYCIIATRASVFATDESLAWAKKEILGSKSITELDIYEKYLDLLKKFQKDNNIPININTFWTNCHSSKRSIIPSLPFNHQLDESARAIKIDAGVSLRGETGIHYAASDIARTIIFDDEVQKAYNKFEDYMVRNVIPNIKPGMSGKDIHELAVTQIEKERYFFENIGMIPAGNLNETFNRDVGHLVGLQEPVTMFFTKNTGMKVDEGMIGALEYQWSYKGFGIGVEDLFVIESEGGLNYSRDGL
ncbi:MAG TPA: M24 family metallopeptidase [Clostridia bacterium]|nr:M24 family metallopeptidase [Clostridia bacterium]